jgi:hypothetical protein
MKTKFEVTGTKFPVAADDHEYLSSCVWMKRIEKRHCGMIIDSAKRLVEYAKVDNEALLTFVSDFEYAMRDHEMVRRRQVRALMYLVETKIL